MSETRPLHATFGFPMGVVLAMCASAVFVAGDVRQESFWSLLAMIAVVTLVAQVSTTGAAMSTAVVCWALHAGFVLGRGGELAFSARSADDALVLAVCALAACGVACLRRSAVRQPERTPFGPRAVPVPAPRRPVSEHAGQRATPVSS